MENKYNHKEIERKWQKYWEDEKIYKVSDSGKKKKFYILDMFPYPSGEGLHVGHPKGYIATDIFARMKIMQGFNVLHPMGFDAFGLPAENYALKNKVHPKLATEENINTFKKQLRKFGFTYDWEREVNTTDPEFYKWTQWIFLQMFERGLVYESNEPINWCPSCKTGLANEDLEDGKCERCDSVIERKPIRQWVLRITNYAERLLSDLDKLPFWEEAIKEQQKSWIGKSEGAEVDFEINDEKITVFTTRPDTLFGATYFVVAPEHPLVSLITTESCRKDVDEYIIKTSNKSNLERTGLQKEKTGVFTGAYARNPVNHEEIPVWIADYVLMGYGTGAIMAVPAHDQRDFEFAQKFNIPIKPVVKPVNADFMKGKTADEVQELMGRIINGDECFSEYGEVINSDFLDGLSTKEAKEKMIKWLEHDKSGKRAINYKIQDWVFSRQRYWGEPIPLIHCSECGVVPVNLEDLPLTLPEVDNYEPTGTGESPLAAIKSWVEIECPKCGRGARRETNTMPQWAGSSWYYLRYIDPKNKKELVNLKKEKYWSPVDFYVGGAEHATRHLIYARFWHKFLFDIGVVSFDEPFTRLQHVGLIQGEDNRKMSKRWGNVINPDDIIESYGADSMRVYEMFMGPFSQAASWNTNGLIGARKFLERVWNLQNIISEKESRDELKNILHKTIKKVGEDIESFKFNTAISQMMILSNKMSEEKSIAKEDYLIFISILAPFAPHLAEEIREALGEKGSFFKDVNWAEYDQKLIIDKKINLVIQVNGKVRVTLEVGVDISEDEAKKIATENEIIKKWTKGKKIVKVIFVKGKLINIVVK